MLSEMGKSNIDFLARDEFSKLSLHEKNSYLQELADTYADATKQEKVVLSKEALSRLRRFYSRRSLADLKLEKMIDKDMAGVMSRLANAVHQGMLENIINSEIPPSSTKRVPPIDDEQMMFFVPNIHDAPIKDDVNLMDVAPFSLSKAKREGVIKYDLKDCSITVTGSAETGMANAYDYDVFLNMVSHLAEQMRIFKRDKNKGLNPSLPPKMYQPTATQILKFCRREDGGRQYEQLEKALDRLQSTNIKIVNFRPDARRETETFSLIQRYKVLSRTANDKIERVLIEIPDWVYDGIVHEKNASSILTLNPDYFLLKKSTARFVYRLARKAAGQSEAHYKVSDLHMRSGTKSSVWQFERKIKELVADAANDPLPDYNLRLSKGRDGSILHISRRELPCSEETEAPSSRQYDLIEA